MKTYEKPFAEIIEFMAETIMTEEEEFDPDGIGISGGVRPRPV